MPKGSNLADLLPGTALAPAAASAKPTRRGGAASVVSTDVADDMLWDTLDLAFEQRAGLLAKVDDDEAELSRPSSAAKPSRSIAAGRVEPYEPVEITRKQLSLLLGPVHDKSRRAAAPPVDLLTGSPFVAGQGRGGEGRESIPLTVLLPSGGGELQLQVALGGIGATEELLRAAFDACAEAVGLELEASDSKQIVLRCVLACRRRRPRHIHTHTSQATPRARAHRLLSAVSLFYSMFFSQQSFPGRTRETDRHTGHSRGPQRPLQHTRGAAAPGLRPQRCERSRRHPAGAAPNAKARCFRLVCDLGGVGGSLPSPPPPRP